MSEIEKRMQVCLDRLGVPLTVTWTPNNAASRHGEIKGNLLLIYDADAEEAWKTLFHEVLEHKFKQVTFVYRTIINSLIEAVEKVTYTRKEEFLEFLPKLWETVEKEKYKQKG